MVEISIRRNLLPFTLISVALVFAAIENLTNLAPNLGALFTPLSYPENVKFEAYGKLLHDFVDDQGLVAYEKLKTSPQLSDALGELAHTNVGRVQNPRARLAYWINAYNLLNLKNICDEYPLSDVHQLTQKNALRHFIVGGRARAIDSIDSAEIKSAAKAMNPDVLFLRCNGAQDDPILLNKPITAENIDALASAQVKAYAQDTHHFLFDARRRAFLVSKFYQWNEDVLNVKYVSPWQLVNTFLPSANRIPLGEPGFVYGFLPKYNWTLNNTHGAK